VEKSLSVEKSLNTAIGNKGWASAGRCCRPIFGVPIRESETRHWRSAI